MSEKDTEMNLSDQSFSTVSCKKKLFCQEDENRPNILLQKIMHFEQKIKNKE